MQRCREQNIELISSYLREGCKPEAHRLGVELEHDIVHDDGRPASYSEPGGVRDLLERLSAHYGKRVEEAGNIVGLANPGEDISIEPAAQVEISGGPYVSAADFARCYSAFRSRLDPELEALGLHTAIAGYNPVAKEADLELIPKFRYRCMDRYLGAISPYGPRMMRATTSLQVSIDFRSEADAVRKFRLANVVGPFLALVCDNAPVYEGAPNPHHAVRVRVWEDVDPDRCNVVPGGVDPGFSFCDYARYVLDVPAILVPDPSRPEGFRYVGGQAFGDVYADRPMTRAEIEHALSMEWPDVRLKHFVEIRPADALPMPYSAAYVALVEGLFYSDASLDALDEAFEGVTQLDVEAAKWKVVFDGYDARAYRKPAHEWAEWLFEVARAALPADEAAYLDPLEGLVSRRACPRDVLWNR